MEPQAPEQNVTPAPTPPPAEVPQGTVPTVPPTWPGAWGVYKHSKAVVKRNLAPLLTLFVINLVLGLAGRRLAGAVGSLLLDVISVILSYMTYTIYLAGLHGESKSLGDAFKELSVGQFFSFLGVLILTGLIVVISLLLLIVPFFFVFPRIVLAPYIVVDKRCGIGEAVRASWDMTDGHKGKALGILGATIAMALLIITIIGIPFALYFLFMYGAAYVVLYGYLQAQTAPVAEPPSTAPAPAEPAQQ